MSWLRFFSRHISSPSFAYHILGPCHSCIISKKLYDPVMFWILLRYCLSEIHVMFTYLYYHIFLLQVQHEISLGLNTANLPREKWDTWDPTLISEVKMNLNNFKFYKFCQCHQNISICWQKLSNSWTSVKFLILPGFVRSRQHLLLAQTSLHILCQPSSRSTTGKRVFKYYVSRLLALPPSWSSIQSVEL